MKAINGDLQASFAVFASSIALRAGYLAFSIPPNSPTGGHVDIWGDGVHFWLLSYLTAKNNFFYSDLRPNGLQLIWLPLHPMITAFAMRVTGIYSLDIIRALDVLYGSLTAVVVYRTARLLFKGGTHVALAAGLGLAFNAWWIATNSEGVVESLLALLLSLLFYYWIRLRPVVTSLLILVAGFVKYEAWVITFMLLFADFIIRGFSRKISLPYIAAWVTPILVWSGWSYRLTGNPIAWYVNQAGALAWDISILGKPSSAVAGLYYPALLMLMTGGLFAVACLSAIKRSGYSRTLLGIGLAYLVIRSAGYALGLHLPLERFIVILIPLTYLLAVWPLPSDLNIPSRRTVYAVAFLIIILVPFITQIAVFQKMSYIYNPQMRAGVWLRDHYDGGVVVSDLPTTIAYAYPNPSPERFLSAAIVYEQFVKHDASLRWLYLYFAERGVAYFVWNYVPYSASWQIEEAQGSMLKLRQGSDSYYFKLVYSDTAGNPNYWEHRYGVPDLFIYRIEYSDYWLQPTSLPS